MFHIAIYLYDTLYCGLSPPQPSGGRKMQSLPEHHGSKPGAVVHAGDGDGDGGQKTPAPT